MSVVVARINRMADLMGETKMSDSCRHPVTLIIKRGSRSLILPNAIDDRVVHVCTKCGAEAWKGQAEGWTKQYGNCDGCSGAIITEKWCKRCSDEKIPTPEGAGLVGTP